MNMNKIIKRLRPSSTLRCKLNHVAGQVVMPDDLAIIIGDRETFSKGDRKWARSVCKDAVTARGKIMMNDRKSEDAALVAELAAYQ